MTRHEMKDEFGYYDGVNVPSVIVLSDGTKLFPSRDPEGNGPGEMFGTSSDGFKFTL